MHPQGPAASRLRTRIINHLRRWLRIKPVTVPAQYQLPHHIWVDYSVIGHTFHTYIGPVRAKIIMPLRTNSSTDLTAHPHVPGAPDEAWSTEDQWSTTYAAFGTDNKTALRRIALELSEEGRPIPAYRPYPAKPTHPAQQVAKLGTYTAACVEEWFKRVADWTSVVTGEDVNHRHPIYNATTIGPGFSYWAGSKWEDGGFRAMMPEPRALTRISLQAILDRVAEHEEPPIEHQLTRDSVAAFRRDDPRKAVLDAATAVEICLIRLVQDTEHATGTKCKDTKGLIPRSNWLESNASAYTADPGLKKLAKIRNAVIHAGESVTIDDADDIVRTAIAIVEEHGRSRDPRRPRAS